jgi:hypothetical protein
VAVVGPGAVGIAISVVGVAVPKVVVPVPIVVGVVPRIIVAVPVVCQRGGRSERHAAEEGERKRGVKNGIGHLEPHYVASTG